MRVLSQPLTQRQKKQAGAGSAAAVSVFLVWLCGYLGISLSAEMGTVIGAFAVTMAATIWSEGIKGVFVHIWRGDEHHDRQVTVETDTAAKVTVQEHEGPPPVDDRPNDE